MCKSTEERINHISHRSSTRYSALVYPENIGEKEVGKEYLFGVEFGWSREGEGKRESCSCSNGGHGVLKLTGVSLSGVERERNRVYFREGGFSDKLVVIWAIWGSLPWMDKWRSVGLVCFTRGHMRRSEERVFSLCGALISCHLGFWRYLADFLFLYAFIVPFFFLLLLGVCYWEILAHKNPLYAYLLGLKYQVYI